MENELHPEMLSLHSICTVPGGDSGNRAVMTGSHFSQRLVTIGAEEKILQTGVEREMSKYTFAIRMPEDGRIVKVIERYPRGLDSDGIQFNPETLVIYEDDRTKELGCFSIPTFASFHQYFGFKYVYTEAMNLIRPGNFIAKDTVFADSPSVGKNGAFKFGTPLNMALMTHPAVSEDGVAICEDVLPRLRFPIFETRTVEFGKNSFPVNLYGTADNYKPHPDIGEYLREDGLLMVMRPYEKSLVPVEMSIYDTMEPDFTFDKGVYVRGGRGKVIDIVVHHDDSDFSLTPALMTVTTDKYARAHKAYYRSLLDTERQIRSERRKKFGDGRVALKPELHRLMVEALAVCQEGNVKGQQRINKQYRKNPLDDYRITFTIEYEMTPTKAYKITDTHGGKGVIVKILKPEEMPVDEAGNRADVIMDSGSTINRKNVSRAYEMYFSAAARDVTKNFMGIIGMSQMSESKALKELIKLSVSDPARITTARDYLAGFYAIISPRQYEFFTALEGQDILEWMAGIVSANIARVYLPTDNPPEPVDIVKQLEQYYRPTYGPVTYVGNSGRRVTTHENVRIAPLYMMLLEQIGDNGSSVAYGKLQHFGVLSPVTRHEKYSSPNHNSPVRTIGETEGRIFSGYVGREGTAEMMDRSNNPQTHRHLVWNVLNAGQPTNIEKVVDRNVISLGGAKPIQLVKHLAMCSGWKPVYKKPQSYNK